jgi:membrane fusion protein (multidrug efflux system)
MSAVDDVAGAASPSRSRRRYLAYGLGLILAAGIAWYGHHWWTVGRFIEDTDDAYVGGDVTVLAPKVSGFIEHIAVTDNQQVHAGQLLVKLDDRDYRAALAKEDAAVAAARANLVNLQALRKVQLATIAEAAANIQATDAEIVRTKADQTRYRNLSGSSAVSIQAYQKAEADYKTAAAAGSRAQAALDAAQQQLSVLDTRQAQLQAALSEVQAERDLAALNLSYTELRAPIDGAVGNRSAQTGSLASAGTPLLSLVPARGLWVDANFKESQLAKLHPGQDATIKADVLPGQVFHGHVVSLAPATGAQFSVLPPENATGNFTKIVQRVPVRILLDGDGGVLGRLRPGLSVTVDIDTRG